VATDGFLGKTIANEQETIKPPPVAVFRRCNQDLSQLFNQFGIIEYKNVLRIIDI
jgi:hypothetical protein